MFDYVLLGKGKPKNKVWQEMRREFEYWYPFDFRNSGKDLVQNHLSFSLFNHVAIFPEKHWPQGFGVNGWLLVNGEKMSKSKGNFYTIKQILQKYPADILRTTLMSGGEGLDDPNFDFANADAIKNKLLAWYDFAIENYNGGSPGKSSVDAWFESVTNKTLREATAAMEETMFKTAVDKGFFEMQRALKWYLRRTKPNKQVISNFIEMQTKIIAPFAPHLAEEIWSELKKKGFISIAEWPSVDESKILVSVEAEEQQLQKSIDDIRQILKLVGKEAKKIFLYVIPKELEAYKSSEAFLSSEFSAKVQAFAVNDAKKYDPQNKSSKAKPGKPGIYVE
jgi:leucyl-tRNA synthetase